MENSYKERFDELCNSSSKIDKIRETLEQNKVIVFPVEEKETEEIGSWFDYSHIRVFIEKAVQANISILAVESFVSTFLRPDKYVCFRAKRYNYSDKNALMEDLAKYYAQESVSLHIKLKYETICEMLLFTNLDAETCMGEIFNGSPGNSVVEFDDGFKCISLDSLLEHLRQKGII